MDVPNVFSLSSPNPKLFPKMFPIPPPFIPLSLIKVEPLKLLKVGQRVSTFKITFWKCQHSVQYLIFIYFCCNEPIKVAHCQKKKSFGMHPQLIRIHKKTKNLLYMNKDGNPSTKSTRHVKANVNT